MLKRAIQGAFSTNCIAATGLKSVHSGTHTARPRIDPASAVQRAGAGLRSSPKTSTAIPKAIGTQMVSGRRYPWNIVVVFFGRRGLSPAEVDEEEAEEREHAEDHRERVGIDVARLHAPRDPREPADQMRSSVHHDAVDDRLVAPRPQARADAPRAAGEEPVVELVEVVLAIQDLDQGAQLAARDGGELRAFDEEEPRGRGAREGEP